MSKCTATQAVESFEYWLGYHEKATAKYATFRGKEYFEADSGANNYTYAGYLCGVQGGAWCAMQVSTAIYEACGNDITAAKAVMHGVWPYTACNQVYDAAPSGSKGRRGAFTPKPGDIIVFTNNGTSRDHTGMVYAVDDTYVYTYEGNSGNMCRKRSYPLTSSYIYGYVKPDYAEGGAADIEPDQYGSELILSVRRHVLSKGCAGDEVRDLQALLNVRGASLDVDGEFGPKTQEAVKGYREATRDAEDAEEVLNNELLFYRDAFPGIDFDAILAEAAQED